jgi:hypothetical protein
LNCTGLHFSSDNAIIRFGPGIAEKCDKKDLTTAGKIPYKSPQNLGINICSLKMEMA